MWKLFKFKDGKRLQEIVEGDEIKARDGKVWEVAQGVGAPPHKISSTGRVYVKGNKGSYTAQYFPTVFDCKWVEV